MSTRGDLDFERLFASAPGRFLALEHDPPHYTIVGATEAYLEATLTRREEVIGRDLFEVFPAAEAESFRSKLSHELRTPLNAIIGFSDLLHEDARELNPPQREHLRYVRESGRHLLRLIDELLEQTTAAASRLTLPLEPIAVSGLAGQIRDQLRPQAEKSGVAIAIEIPDGVPAIEGDVTRLTQILATLVANGVELTPRGGEVRIRAEVDGDHVVISSDLGRGTTFSVRVPTTAPPPAVAASESTEVLAAQASAHNVLLVEDDALSQKLAHTVLSRRGYVVSVASSLSEARHVLGHIRPSVVVTDIEFPDGGGRRLLEELRADPALASIPVLAMTAHAMDGERDRLLLAGFDAYLSKPIAIDELARIVDGLIARGRR